MMRIEKKARRNLRLHEGNVSATKNNKISSLEQTFQDVLHEQSFLQGQEKLALLLVSLEEIGERLVKSFSIYDLLAYKERLRGFLDETMQQVYEIKKESGWTGTGRAKLLQRVELLNQEMEDLTKTVLEKQKDSVKLLKKLDNIRGLLIDLYS